MATPKASEATTEQNPIATDDWGSRSHVLTLVLLLMTVLGMWLCWRMTVPFLPALVWALALAVLCHPLQVRLERCTGHPSLAAIVTTLIVAALIVAPAVFVLQQLSQQALAAAGAIQHGIESGEWQAAVAAQPRLRTLVQVVEKQIDLSGIATSLAGALSAHASQLVKATLVQLIGFGLMLYILFFFLRDRRQALDWLCRMSPLTRAEMHQLFNRVRHTIRATVFGTVLVALIQGALGGLMFWWLGLPAPLLWGMVMALISIVPVLGAFVVWIPAALWLAVQGEGTRALVLVGWGTLVIGTVDNLLRPVLVGRELREHTLLAFISVVGGITLFGAAGLVLGPIVFELTRELLQIWSRRNARQLEAGNDLVAAPVAVVAPNAETRAEPPD